MRRLHWDVLLALLVGLGIGLVYAWVIAPKGMTGAAPNSLRLDFKDQYRSLIAAAYAATDNLPRARARLSLLGDSDSIEALNAQAQRMLGTNSSFGRADQVAALASALDGNSAQASSSPTPTTESANESNGETIPTATLPPPPPEGSMILTVTPQTAEPQPVDTEIVPTPRPTRTLVPTLGAPFTMTGQETVCDSNLPDGLLQVMVLNSSRRQLAGVEIVITWDAGKESFFTGLKPELGNGYADYVMAPDTTYAVQLARGSDVALGVTAPTCQTPSGENFFGGIKLTFQQP